MIHRSKTPFFRVEVLVRIFRAVWVVKRLYDEPQLAQRPKITHSKSKLAEAKTVIRHSLQTKHHFLHWLTCYEHLSQHRERANSEHFVHQKLTCG